MDGLLHDNNVLQLINLLGWKQALTKAYSPYDMMSVGISNKSEFTYCKNGPIYPVLAWCEYRHKMNQAFVVNGHYTNC